MKGFVLDSTSLQCIVKRYGGREGRICEDDFIQSYCRVMSLYSKLFSKGGYQYDYVLLKDRTLSVYNYKVFKNSLI